jgi:superfamily II DNA or RNA helicase
MALEPGRKRLCAKLPTGYGKTFAAACVYSSLQAAGMVDRLLYLVPSISQLDQFVTDGHSDLEAASVEGSHYICDIAFAGAVQATKQHRQGSHQVFACTIQGLSSAGTGAIVKSLMETGRWMICVDEYHHYGEDKTWGKAVIALERLPQCKYLLAMSATPYRPDSDSAFGEPEVIVTYQQAVKEKAVKPMTCHSYTYKIDAIEDGDVVSYTTGELIDKADGDSPEALERVFQKMRWSPKYISPLVDTPITRMLQHRLQTGYRLQALIGAFCCSHAQLVAEQVQAMFPELKVDWVGTGANGRSDAENRRVLEKFCPPKKDGKRDPKDIKIDVLVHVGMAGEGLDTIYVSEVIHLNPANKNNSNDQENGRGARFLPDVMAYISVETGSDYACPEYIGRGIEKAFDMTPEEAAEDDSEPTDVDDDGDWPELPEEPEIDIYDVTCIQINTGEVARMEEAVSRATGFDMSDPRVKDAAIRYYREMRQAEAEQFNDRSTVEQWKSAVEQALGYVSRRVIKQMMPGASRVDRSLIGDIRKRINSRKKRALGAIDKDVVLLKRHYTWLKELESDLIEGGIPQWLQ